MAHHTYFPSKGPNASNADVVVKCSANGSELPAHRHYLAALSPSLEAAVVQYELNEDRNASGLVEQLIGDAVPDEGQPQLPRLYLQSTSEESVRLLLGHAYGIEIGNRLCVKTASEVAIVARKYEIPILLHKVDAFLAKAMEDRTTDRLRCKPAFWAAHKEGITDSAIRFLSFAEQASLALMHNAVVNLVAHIAVLDHDIDLAQRPLSCSVAESTWKHVARRMDNLQSVIAEGAAAGSGISSPRSPFSLSSSSSTSSPGGSPRTWASHQASKESCFSPLPTSASLDDQQASIRRQRAQKQGKGQQLAQEPAPANGSRRRLQNQSANLITPSAAIWPYANGGYVCPPSPFYQPACFIPPQLFPVYPIC